MIDTDKYEGHTPAPWTLSEEYAYELFIYAGGVRLAKMDGDAPLLLAEVKRLQGYNSALLHWMMNHLDRDEDEIKEMIYE